MAEERDDLKARLKNKTLKAKRLQIEGDALKEENEVALVYQSNKKQKKERGLSSNPSPDAKIWKKKKTLIQSEKYNFLPWFNEESNFIDNENWLLRKYIIKGKEEIPSRTLIGPSIPKGEKRTINF